MAPRQIEIGCKAPGFCRGEVICCSEGVRSQAQEASEGKTLTHRADAPPRPLAARVTGIFRQVPDAGYPEPFASASRARGLVRYSRRRADRTVTFADAGAPVAASAIP